LTSACGALKTFQLSEATRPARAERVFCFGANILIHQTVSALSAHNVRNLMSAGFRSGAVLPRYELVYETYGTLNADKSNAI